VSIFLLYFDDFSQKAERTIKKMLKTANKNGMAFCHTVLL